MSEKAARKANLPVHTQEDEEQQRVLFIGKGEEALRISNSRTSEGATSVQQVMKTKPPASSEKESGGWPATKKDSSLPPIKVDSPGQDGSQTTSTETNILNQKKRPLSL